VHELPLLRARHLQTAVDFLEEAGVPIEPLLDRTRLRPVARGCADALVPAVAVYRFRELAAQREGLPNLGLALAESRRIEDALGDLGRSILAASSVHRALSIFCAEAGKECSRLQTGLVEHDETAQVWHRNDTRAGQEDWHAELYCTRMMLRIVQLYHADWRPSEIRFRSLETPERLLVSEALGCERLVFGCEATSFELPRAMLANRSDPDCTDAGSPGRPDLPDAATATHQLREVLRNCDTSCLWNLDEAVEALGIPGRTLQRRLASEGSSYSSLTTEVRMERATALLAGEDIELRELALMLGYSTHSNFTRAFHEWAGLTPTEFRRQRVCRAEGWAPGP